MIDSSLEPLTQLVMYVSFRMLTLHQKLCSVRCFRGSLFGIFLW